MAGRVQELAVRRLRQLLEVLNNESLAYVIAIQVCKTSKAEGSPELILLKFVEQMEAQKKKLREMERGQVWEGVTITQQGVIVDQLGQVQGQVEGEGVDAAIIDLQNKVEGNRFAATDLTVDIQEREKKL